MDNKEFERKMQELEARETELAKEKVALDEEKAEAEEMKQKSMDAMKAVKRKETINKGIAGLMSVLAVIILLGCTFAAGIILGRNLWFLQSVGF